MGSSRPHSVGYQQEHLLSNCLYKNYINAGLHHYIGATTGVADLRDGYLIREQQKRDCDE